MKSRWYGYQPTIVLQKKTGECLLHGSPEEVLFWLNNTSRRDFVIATGDDCIEAREIYLRKRKSK